jgi:hypothetical protein
MFSINLDIGNIVLEDSWNVHLCVQMISLTLSTTGVVGVGRITKNWNGSNPRSSVCSCKVRMIRQGRLKLTSGNVPFENTLQRR